MIKFDVHAALVLILCSALMALQLEKCNIEVEKKITACLINKNVVFNSTENYVSVYGINERAALDKNDDLPKVQAGKKLILDNLVLFADFGDFQHDNITFNNIYGVPLTSTLVYCTSDTACEVQIIDSRFKGDFGFSTALFFCSSMNTKIGVYRSTFESFKEFSSIFYISNEDNIQLTFINNVFKGNELNEGIINTFKSGFSRSLHRKATVIFEKNEVRSNVIVKNFFLFNIEADITNLRVVNNTFTSNTAVSIWTVFGGNEISVANNKFSYNSATFGMAFIGETVGISNETYINNRFHYYYYFNGNKNASISNSKYEFRSTYNFKKCPFIDFTVSPNVRLNNVRLLFDDVKAKRLVAKSCKGNNNENKLIFGLK